MASITQRLPDLENIGPVIELLIAPSQAYIQNSGINPGQAPSIRVTALIDTGASATVISENIGAALGLSPVGSHLINTPSSQNVRCFQYDIQLIFPNNVVVSSLVVTEAPLKGQPIQCLIGRDLLKHGVLIYLGYDNSFTLSF